MKTIRDAAARTAMAGIAAAAMAMVVTIGDLGTAVAAAEATGNSGQGGFELTVETPTPAATLPGLTAATPQKTGTQLSPRSRRKDWNANSDLPIPGRPNANQNPSAGSAGA